MQLWDRHEILILTVLASDRWYGPKEICNRTGLNPNLVASFIKTYKEKLEFLNEEGKEMKIKILDLYRKAAWRAAINYFKSESD